MIGFIGLGIMGNHMAENLLDNGQELIVHNRTKAKADNLLNKGAKWAESPAQVAKEANVIFTMLTNEAAVEGMAFGDNGFLNGDMKGKLWVDCSTVDPKFSELMARESEAYHVRFLDAPVSGSKIPAQKGELIFLVGGNEADLKEIRPLLEIMGKAIQYHGVNGKGSSMKLVINLMLAQSMAAFSEAIHFGEAIGLEKETVIDTLLNSPTAAPILKLKRDKLLNNEFAEEFPLEHMHKDLNLVAQAAYASNTAMPVANATKELFGMAKQKGLGRKDLSAIYQYITERE
ncbi:NAD(P)-dependent oxidoreductase [Aquibacillus kalidii]|uniref:NAD(P)-dependent oxidoreductase n=1 Tax=Aquibacillus kalidii TaxID=2762597 RepID=UPI001644363E|nr:NAD(P)-dependent oxidoreductase [Aquibacillus kalidii]